MHCARMRANHLVSGWHAYWTGLNFYEQASDFISTSISRVLHVTKRPGQHHHANNAEAGGYSSQIAGRVAISAVVVKPGGEFDLAYLPLSGSHPMKPPAQNFAMSSPVHCRQPIKGVWFMFCSSWRLNGVEIFMLMIGSLFLASGFSTENEERLTQRSPSLGAQDSAVSSSVSPAVSPMLSLSMTVPATVGSSELRDALALVVIERNAISLQRDSLLQQRWLIIAYAIFTSLLVGGFIRASLVRRSGPAILDAQLVVPYDAAGRKRANATITIRNATTQRAEIIERVATRKLFKSRPASEVITRVAAAHATIAKPIPSAAPARAEVTTTEIIKAPANSPVKTPVNAVEKTVIKAVIKPAIQPASAVPIAGPKAEAKSTAAETVNAARSDPHYDYAPTDAKPTHLLIGHRPSILLAPEIDDSLPETTQVRIARSEGRVLARQGFSLLEVMIALAILATVLASIAGGIVSLTSAKRSASEETAVSDLMRRWSERIIGGDWEWLGRDRSEDPLNGAWSWQRPETESPLAQGDYPPLREGVKEQHNNAAIQVLGTEQSGLTDLRLYLEYYQPIALELCFTPVDGAAARSTWADTRNAYRLTPPIDLRKQIDAVVVRLSATWSAANGGTRRRELVFARVK